MEEITSSIKSLSYFLFYSHLYFEVPSLNYDSLLTCFTIYNAYSASFNEMDNHLVELKTFLLLILGFKIQPSKFKARV
jgi:hypothetical protein